MRILIVGKHTESIEITRSCLCAENYVIDVIHEYKQGLYLAENFTYNLIILSYTTTKQPINFCSQLRDDNSHTPVIILTKDCQSLETARVLDYGADDCIQYPFNCNEFLARIRALLRRPYKIESEILTASDLTLDMKRCIVQRKRKEIYLTRKEFLLLEYLMRNKSEVQSRDDIMESVWDTKINPFSNTLESHIHSLRKKIESKNGTKLIITVPGRGYKIQESFNQR